MQSSGTDLRETPVHAVNPLRHQNAFFSRLNNKGALD